LIFFSTKIILVSAMTAVGAVATVAALAMGNRLKEQAR